MEQHAPVIVKHEILARLEELSHDYDKVCSMRNRLKNGAPAEELAESAVQNRVCSREVADKMLRFWANVGDGGWFGEIMEEVHDKFLEAANLIGPDGPYLSAWWILGVTDRFRLAVFSTRESVFLILLTPHLTPDQHLAKREWDPSLDRLIRQYVNDLRDMLP